MNFFIKKNSTYPILKYPLTQKIMELYDINDDILENVAITFSMIDADTGVFRIANVEANLVINTDRSKYPDEAKYTLTYQFKLRDSSKIGRYQANFTIDFLGNNCGKIALPINSYIDIIVSDSLTKTTVI